MYLFMQDSKASVALHCSGPSGCTCTDDGQRMSDRFIGRMDYVMTTSEADAEAFVAVHALLYITDSRLYHLKPVVL